MELGLKRSIVMIGVMLTLMTHSLAQAQERDPLFMRIELEWTLAGTVFGALVGAAIWLTDPGNPHFTLSETAVEGAALGTLVGAGFGIYVMQMRVQYPSGFADGRAGRVEEPMLAGAWNGGMPPTSRGSVIRGMNIPLAQLKLRF